jgi:hypothetical protein
MPTRLNDALKISRKSLENKGVYNGLIDFDSRLHIDPALVSITGIQEFNEGKKKIVLYFTKILRLIKASIKVNDVFWKNALALVSTGEGLNTGLGYAKKGTGGSGFGPKIANQILITIQAIQKAGVDDPEIFELVGIFEEKIGPDKISDMISIILKEEFLKYTQRISKELMLKVFPCKTDKGNFNLPINNTTKEYFVFVPKSILNDLPIAESWSDIPFAASYSQEIKSSLNRIVGDSWKELGKISKNKIKEILIEFPELLRDLLSQYKNRTRIGYDFNIDHLGELIWDIVGNDAINKNPLKLTTKVEDKNILDVVTIICNQFKKLIEENGLVEHIYDLNKKRRPERFPQLLLFAVADSYCNANNLDLSREPNAGSGALDFKVSRGLKKVSCEIKYSSNPKLVEGYEKQLKAYNKAESILPNNSIYLILKVNEKSNHKIKEIENTITERLKRKQASPRLIVIDAIKQVSASKR